MNGQRLVLLTYPPPSGQPFHLRPCSDSRGWLSRCGRSRYSTPRRERCVPRLLDDLIGTYPQRHRN